MLARTVYNDRPSHDPRELLDQTRFPAKEAIEDHFLDAYITASYEQQPTWTADQTRRWLGYLAVHLQTRNTHDLAWWQLPASLHRHTRILTTTATFGLVVVLAYVLAYMFLYGLSVGLSVGLGLGLALGLGFGLAAGLVNEVGFFHGRNRGEPEQLRLGLRRRGPARHSSGISLNKSTSEFTHGLVFGLVYGLATGLAFVLTGGLTAGLTAGLAFVLPIVLPTGLGFGLGFGLVNVVVSALGDNHDPHATNPWKLLTTDRAVTLVRTIATVLVLWLAAGEVDGLAFAEVLVFGLTGGLGRLALSAWGRWLLFARLWLPLTRRLPWRPKRFLEDAYQRGVLRQAGAVYQFRHARLQEHLARTYRTRREKKASSTIQGEAAETAAPSGSTR